MLKELFNKDMVFELSIEDLQTLSDFVGCKLDEENIKEKKDMSFEEYYTKKYPIKVVLDKGKLQIAEDLSKLYMEE